MKQSIQILVEVEERLDGEELAKLQRMAVKYWDYADKTKTEPNSLSDFLIYLRSFN